MAKHLRNKAAFFLSLTSLLAFLCTPFVLTSAAADQTSMSTTATEWGPTANGLKLSISSPRAVFRKGQAIPVTFTIHNSGRAVSIRRLGSVLDYTITVVTPSGRKIAADNSKITFSGSVRPWDIPTGANYLHVTKDLGKLFYFGIGGEYQISGTTNIRLKDSTNVYAVLHSNVLTIHLVQ